MINSFMCNLKLGISRKKFARTETYTVAEEGDTHDHAELK